MLGKNNGMAYMEFKKEVVKSSSKKNEKRVHMFY